MIFSSSVIEAISSTWSAHQEDPRKNQPQRELPDDPALARIIEVAFVASLLEVEGRRTRFALAVLPREETKRDLILGGRPSKTVAFESEIALTADALSRLATACDPSFGCLLVDTPVDSHGIWAIWGLGFYEPSGATFGGRSSAGLPCSIGFSAMRPDSLTITSLSPGSLDIIRGDSRIGQFVMGRFYPALPTPLSRMGMGKHIAKRIREEGASDRQGTWYFDQYVRWLEYLLAEIGRRGHGGTVLFCPRSLWRTVSSSCKGGQKVLGGLSLGQIFDAVYREESSIRPGAQMTDLLSATVGIEKCNEHLRRRLAFVAQLAVCDGALVVAEHFEPLAYGTMLPANDWEGPAVAGEDGYGHGGERYDLRQHGMRHRTAASFVAERERLFAFVISQDGPIRGFARGEAGSLLVWSDCRASAFA